MKTHRNMLLIGLVVAVAVWISCTASPAARLAATAEAIATMRATFGLELDPRMNDELRSAESLWQEAHAEAASQRQRRWALRSYRRVGLLLDDAAVHLGRAASIAARGERLANLRARQTITQAQHELERVAALIDSLPVGRDTAHDRAGMLRDVAALRRALAVAREAESAGDPRAAAGAAAAVAREARIVRTLAGRALEHMPVAAAPTELGAGAQVRPTSSRP